MPPSDDRLDEEIDSEDGGSDVRMADPVNAYLRSIGDLGLITREREVEIAKRILEGRHRILTALGGSAIARRELAKLRAALRGGNMALGDLFDDVADETFLDEARAQRVKALARPSVAWGLPWRPWVIAAV